jgi:hypothetical protein
VASDSTLFGARVVAMTTVRWVGAVESQLAPLAARLTKVTASLYETQRDSPHHDSVPARRGRVPPTSRKCQPPTTEALPVASRLPEYALLGMTGVGIQLAETGGDRLAATDNGELK